MRLRRSSNAAATTTGSNTLFGFSNSSRALVPALLVALGVTSLLSFYSSRQYWSVAVLHQHNPVRQALLGFESSYAPTERHFNPRDDASHTEPTLSREVPAERVPETVSTSETKAELIARLYPNETALPNPQTLADGATTFAACLLVMDDNHRLTEWLAYHYHVLPLRYMVIAIDERSQTTPTHLLNEWRQRGMTIHEWSDADFWRRKDGTFLQPMPDGAAFQQKRDRHRARQKYFYKQCLIHMTRANRTWVSLHDSDEYLVYNHRTTTSQGEAPPSTAQAGAMIRYIEHERAAGLAYYQSACIGIPRLIFGADPQRLDPAHVIRNVPDVLVAQTAHSSARATTDQNTGLAYQMDTLVYRHHAKRNDFVKNALGKVIIDVSRVNVAKTPYFMSLHRPIKTICPPPWHKDADSGLRINHYLGSWESYSFRDDARRGGERSWEQWEYKATTVSDSDADADDTIRPWVSGLVEHEGPDGAVAMLRHVGLPTTYRNADSDAWHLLPDKLAKILNVKSSSTQDNKAEAFEDWVRAKYKTSSR